MSELPRPSLFLSHGAPDLALSPHAAAGFLRGLAGQLPRPKGIVVISAHWQTSRPALTAPGSLGTVHDFMGFPDALYQLSYPAEATEALVSAVEDCLPKRPERVSRGLDHGAWIPLLLAWPDADIPVVQLALERRSDPAKHFETGQALASLRDKGILVLGSGGVVHNLGALAPEGTPTPEWALAFDSWLAQVLAEGDMESLLDFRRRAPHAAIAHPTDEHFRPIFVAAGAGGGGVARSLHSSFSYASIGMRMVAFGEQGAAA